MLCPCADQESIKNDQFRGHTHRPGSSFQHIHLRGVQGGHRERTEGSVGRSQSVELLAGSNVEGRDSASGDSDSSIVDNNVQRNAAAAAITVVELFNAANIAALQIPGDDVGRSIPSAIAAIRLESIQHKTNLTGHAVHVVHDVLASNPDLGNLPPARCPRGGAAGRKENSCRRNARTWGTGFRSRQYSWNARQSRMPGLTDRDDRSLPGSASGSARYRRWRW